MSIRRAPAVTAEQENARLEELAPGLVTLRREPVEPVPPGTLIARLFRVTDYALDCDGSLMACLEGIDADGRTTGWSEDRIGIAPDTTWIVDAPHELDRAAEIEAEFGNRTRRFDRLCREHNQLVEQVIDGLTTAAHKKITVAGLPRCQCGFSLAGGKAPESFIIHALAMLARERDRGDQ